MRFEGSNGIVKVTCGETADLENPFLFELRSLFLAYGLWICLPWLIFLDLPITARERAYLSKQRYSESGGVRTWAARRLGAEVESGVILNSEESSHTYLNHTVCLFRFVVAIVSGKLPTENISFDQNQNPWLTKPIHRCCCAQSSSRQSATHHQHIQIPCTPPAIHLQSLSATPSGFPSGNATKPTPMASLLVARTTPSGNLLA